MTVTVLPRDAVDIASAPDKPITFLIADVAKMTHISQRRILDACRARQLDHVWAGGRRVMTRAQIDAMLAHFSTGVASKPVPDAPVDPLEQARQASRKNAARQRPRRVTA